MTLHDYFDELYALKRHICEGTANGYRHAVRSLDRFAGHPVRLEELAPDLLNGWLRSLSGRMAVTTIAHRRRHAITLWRSAAEDRLCEPPDTRRIRRIRLPVHVPIAWSVDEVRLLAHTAKRLDGEYPGLGVRRHFFWQCCIRLGWDTALRTNDLLRLPAELFRQDHKRALWVQHKTGKPVLIGIHPTTWSFLSAAPLSWGLLLRWPYTAEYFRQEFAEIVRLAGLKGTFKKIRKSSGTDVERRYPGFGPAHLGHSLGPRISTAFYFDPRIVQTDKPMPEEL